MKRRGHRAIQEEREGGRVEADNHVCGDGVTLRQRRHDGLRGRAGGIWFGTSCKKQLNEDSENTMCIWYLGLKLRTEIWTRDT